LPRLCEKAAAGSMALYVADRTLAPRPCLAALWRALQ
jgi:hypothetical protein